MSAAYPGLFWVWMIPTLAIIAIPVLIHLINMLRHRRVEWAAMEFLLLSQKKNRTWIVLKQLLLLLVRMIAVATVVFIVAQPLLYNQWGNLLGGSTTHYVVLLDDSYSMSDRWGDTSAIAEAKKVIRQLGEQAVARAESQTFTVLRFSYAARSKPADMLKAAVNRKDFAEKLEIALAGVDASQTAAGPVEALRQIDELLGDTEDERRVVYLISDFRTREWNDPTDARNLMLEMDKRRTEIHLVNCVEQARPNLAITALTPAEGIRAAGVQFFMDVTVQNFSKSPATNVPVLLEEDGRSRPPVTIARIPAGRTVTERFEVSFSKPGEHRVVARLESDAVAADNARFAVLRIPPDVPVLLIDGDADALDARCLDLACDPRGSVRTGMRPQIETPRYLTQKPLDQFQAINLLNIEHLDKSAIDAVERYIAAGGGVALFVGEKTQTKFVNEQLYRKGKGFFPMALQGRAELLVDRTERAPDVSVEKQPNPIFQDFLDQRNMFLSSVRIWEYFAVPAGWQPKPNSATRIIARLRNGEPLVVERSFGKGRVVVFLTTAAPLWNNWAQRPSFVAVVHRLQAFLVGAAADESRQVCTPLELALPAAAYKSTVSIVPPRVFQKEVLPVTIDATTGPNKSLAVSYPDADLSGIYEAQLTTAGGAEESRFFAVNVDASEGNLETIAGPDAGREIAAKLDPVTCQYEEASAFRGTVGEHAGYNLGEKLLYFLILLLIGEQVLAWSCSYHPSARGQAAQGGAR